MKLHIGCGLTLIKGFVNIDNSPTAVMARLPKFALNALYKMKLINWHQYHFAGVLKEWKNEFRHADCLALPFPDGSAEFCYSSHLIGWYHSYEQLQTFFKEVYRVMQPGGGLRISCFDFDVVLKEYNEHRSTIKFQNRIPSGTKITGFRSKLKFLFSSNRHNGILLNAEMVRELLQQQDFQDIRQLSPGETGMKATWVEGINLTERIGETVYFECRKAG